MIKTLTAQTVKEKFNSIFKNFLDARQPEASSRAQGAFLATISHEIRTPLNAIIGLSEIELQNNLPDNTRKNL